MWWKIILAIVGIIVIGFIGMVIKMAVTDAKEETRDIEEASKKKAKESQLSVNLRTSMTINHIFHHAHASACAWCFYGRKVSD